ncbi:MAG: HU family DNA-binding protein [Lachnospiraceae bacterium]|nr:HU family DNA-binding protein [Lachnospiraceae bacterium]MBQ6195813.1 HU family DNA-binding protein [Lachnospiraceae bacterium]
MNKTELIAAVAEKAEVSKKDAEAVVKAALETVTATLAAGEKVQLIGFGTFETRERAARSGKNPRTGEAVKIKASKVPAFKAGAALKQAVNTKKKSKKK